MPEDYEKWLKRTLERGQDVIVDGRGRPFATVPSEKNAKGGKVIIATRKQRRAAAAHERRQNK